MPVFGTHLFKNLTIATLFIAIVLTGVIILAQSIRFIELIIQSGASSGTFLMMIFYAMPRFLEIILPVAVFAAIIFVYNRMYSDSELIVMRSAGSSPMQLAMPGIILALAISLFMLFITTWLSPVTLAKLQALRFIAKSEYASVILREGVFNTLDNGLTIYIDERKQNQLLGIMVFDDRPGTESPSVITAEEGRAFADENEQRIVVYNGSRQEFDPEKKILSRLNFDQYSITLPESKGPLGQRHKKPDERTLSELLNPDLDEKFDRIFLRDFFVEAHRRIANPFLPLSFGLIALAFFTLGEVNRRGYLKRIVAATTLVITTQSAFLASVSIAKDSDWGLIFMYITVLTPILIGLLVLTPYTHQLSSWKTVQK
ncbi:MAG: LPS export ABC transporter permease LptF [Flavobacteriaceae bacterium]|nr:LPS export ABC transporter permease LptF [Flavobacteriaceae bacterium]